MSGEKQALEDAGHEDQRMVEAAKGRRALEVTAAVGSYLIRETSPKEFASVLRSIAEKLSPDRERRALEVAAKLAAHLLLEENLSYFDCLQFGAHVLVQLYDLDSPADMANWAPQNFTLIQRTIKHMDDLITAPETKAWLQQARSFFKQAEEEARDE